MIIGRKSIIEQNLLRFDKDLNTNSIVELTQPLAEPPAKEAAVFHSTPQQDVSDDLLEEMWLLFERVELIHSTECPAGESSLWYRPVDNGLAIDTGIVNVLREPEKGDSGVSADQVYNSSAVASLPVNSTENTIGLTAKPKWYQPKPETSELNRAHMSDLIHFEPAGEGIDCYYEEPKYRETGS